MTTGYNCPAEAQVQCQDKRLQAAVSESCLSSELEIIVSAFHAIYSFYSLGASTAECT